MSDYSTIYWRNPDKNYAYERIGKIKVGYMTFIIIDESNSRSAESGMYSIRQRSDAE